MNVRIHFNCVYWNVSGGLECIPLPQGPDELWQRECVTLNTRLFNRGGGLMDVLRPEAFIKKGGGGGTLWDHGHEV